MIGELELGWRAMEGETIAITGTNGKTTTTALTGALLSEQPRPVLVAGNIGTPLAAHALSFAVDGLIVAEVSSFQLETIETFQPRVAAVLNVTPDHLDRHGSFPAYLEAKVRIFRNQTPTDCAVLNADDPAAAALASRTRAHVLWFSRRTVLAHGVFVRDGWVVARLNGHVEEIAPLAEIRLRGQHNVENVLAATACALWLGLGAESIRRAIGRFRAVEHRIEFVRDLRGVQFYNDSKGTNVASTIKALESFDERVVLIAGGKGKGQDWAPLAEAARGRVGRAVLIGEDGPRIGAALAGAGIPVSSATTMQARDRRGARPGRAGRRRPALAGVRFVRHVRQLRAPRGSLQASRRSARLVTHARVADIGAGAGMPQARPWLACAVRAGLARPPIPQGGLGRGLSTSVARSPRRQHPSAVRLANGAPEAIPAPAPMSAGSVRPIRLAACASRSGGGAWGRSGARSPPCRTRCRGS